MFRLFHDAFGSEVETWEWLYRAVFREQNLRFGSPRSDTCDSCDRLFIRLSTVDPRNQVEYEQIENEIIVHHHDAESGYLELNSDKQRAKIDPNYVVLAVDLQAVSPKRTIIVPLNLHQCLTELSLMLGIPNS